MRNLFYISCIIIALGIAPAAIAAAATSQDYIRNYVPQAQKVGEGRLTVMVWDVYDAALYAPQGAWKKDEPFALQLSYLREIEGGKIADRSIEEMRAQGITDEVKLAAWHTQMRKIFPDVREGMILTGVYTKSGTTIFYKDGAEVGRVNDPEFSRAFFDIWLDESTNAPALRRKLLGAA